MGFMLDMLEGMLGLTDDEKQRIAPALPYAKQIVDALNAHIDDILTLDQVLVTQQTVVQRIVKDYRVVGPNISLLLGDGWVDVGGTTTAIKDVQAAVATLLANRPDLMPTYNKLVPAINIVTANWPKIQPALAICLAAYKRKGLTSAALLTKLGGVSG